MPVFKRLALIVVAAASVSLSSANCLADEREAAGKLLARTMFNPELRPRTFRGGQWFGNGDSYLALEPSSTPGGTDIVRYQTASGDREIFVPAARLVPAGDKKPLSIESYSLSSDGKQLLLLTNSKTVWRQNTRGDYWLFDLATGALRKLGGDEPASSLMFAKFSPDGSRVAYVRANNLYVEDLATGAIHALTSDGSDLLVNGASDWVYEEELNVRDGFRWAPDGRSLAFWQFNLSGVEQFALINNTDSVYPKIINIPYPMAGTKNSAVRVGVIGVD